MSKEAPATATEMLKSQSHSRVRHAMEHLLHRLIRFVRAYPLAERDQMPGHELCWVTSVDDGPEQVVAMAMRELPALWMTNLPDEVCIVPRAELKKLIGEGATDVLASMGADYVDGRAAQLYRERIERE